ncbi:MAG TPA: DUF6174 domain-containing protein [Gammaproteobacteria bacterium]
MRYLERMVRAAIHCTVVSGAVLGIGPVFADADLDAAQARWRAAALTGYEYGYHKYCDCHRESPPETIVSVRDGKVVRVRHRPAGSTTEVPAADKNFDYYWTVDGLFRLIASALERGVSVRATYDAVQGFPREIYIDYDAELIGDELDLRLTAVRALP